MSENAGAILRDLKETHEYYQELQRKLREAGAVSGEEAFHRLKLAVVPGVYRDWQTYQGKELLWLVKGVEFEGLGKDATAYVRLLALSESWHVKTATGYRLLEDRWCPLVSPVGAVKVPEEQMGFLDPIDPHVHHRGYEGPRFTRVETMSPSGAANRYAILLILGKKLGRQNQ